jgi:hypothetical protein
MFVNRENQTQGHNFCAGLKCLDLCHLNKYNMSMMPSDCFIINNKPVKAVQSTDKQTTRISVLCIGIRCNVTVQACH